MLRCRPVLPRSLLAAVAALGILLSATAIRGPFTLDESNYLVTVVALREGGLAVPGTAGLAPSRELLWFDPGARRRDVAATPVTSTAPPLYAPLALPFSFLGWRGLVALNTLAFLATILVVFAHARRYAATAEAGWIAAAAFGAGGYLIEYAQGVWPHTVTTALVAGAAYLAARALDDDSWVWAAGAGVLVAWASGIRYQNAFLLGCLGLGILLLARRRWRAAVVFAVGAALPLAAAAAINFTRVGSLNPVSKGPGYLPSAAKVTAGATGSTAVERSSWVIERVATMAWARVVDYSAAPTTPGTVSFLSPHPESGAYVLVGAIKKAWLQSAPWIALALAVMALSWLPRSWLERVAGTAGAAGQRQLRLLALMVLSTLAMFAASGTFRTDGFCFNQRYFCELLPLVAVAFAWGVEGIGRRRTALLAGILAGCVLGLVALAPDPASPLRHRLVLYVPLGLAAALLLVWGAARRSPLLAFAAGAALAWAVVLHLGDDLPASRRVREERRALAARVRPYLEGPSALFATGVEKDALGPLVLERDLVLANPALDQAATASELLDGFLAQGRRVFLLPNVLPVERIDRILEGRQIRYLGDPLLLIEVRGGQG